MEAKFLHKTLDVAYSLTVPLPQRGESGTAKNERQLCSRQDYLASFFPADPAAGTDGTQITQRCTLFVGHSGRLGMAWTGESKYAVSRRNTNIPRSGEECPVTTWI